MATSLQPSPATQTTVPLSHSSTRQPPSLLLIVSFLAVYIIWGSTFFAIRIALESFPPLLLAGTRHLGAGLLLCGIFYRRGAQPTRAQWTTAALTGVLLLFGGNGGVCWAEQTVPSGITALLVATVTLWMVLVDWLRPGGHRPSARVLFGIAIGFAGLLVLVGPAHLGNSGRVDPIGAGILVIASLCWACGSLYSKHGSLPASPLLGAGMQALCGGTALWIVGLLTGEGPRLHPTQVTPHAWMAIGYLVFFGSCLGFSAYLYILKKSTAARVATYAFVNPIVAMLLGWEFGGEGLTMRTLIAGAVILTAVVLVITAPHREPVKTAVPVPAGGEA
ncbi:MAG TPA: EamA family transporter [Candidatus Acidoferrum sp.]|nr:EamA family transporter [Candidatus Acidoferrum sp.]